jgi:hypothetical protein
MVDGDNNENIDWGSPDGESVSIIQPLYFFVPAEIIK